jgi:sucrose phosphorylase
VEQEQQIRAHLVSLYGDEKAGPVYQSLKTRLDRFRQQRPGLGHPITPGQRVTEADSILITYGDQVVEPDKAPLHSLAEALDSTLKGVISTVHILPFFPYSSDDGFSVIDYKSVNPDWGDWDDVARVGRHFRLMFDAVINHISAESEWFAGFLQGESAYNDYFLTVDPTIDLSGITRPRTSPLLTPVETEEGPKHVWTTFSADQIDLNYQNPEVLLAIVEVLLFYVAHGAEFIRLDAIAYMWKEIGTSGVHLRQTHLIIQLFRLILDLVAPNVLIITETNVPHRENITYFGDGQNEAQLVYQFTLAPLILHTFHTGDATYLQRWAAQLEELTETTAFFNFIASHDGIGLRPAEGILTADEIQHLVDKAVAHEGLVSYKTDPDGSKSAYELNITLFDALSDPNSLEPQSRQVDRFVASQAIMLAMVGVPGIYVHSLVGSTNDHVGVEETGRARSINRQKWLRAEMAAALDNPNSRSYRIFHRYVALLGARTANRAFHPNARQDVVATEPAVFVLLRTAVDGRERVLCIHNISSGSRQLEIDTASLGLRADMLDILTGAPVKTDGNRLSLLLSAYEVRWLRG